MRHKYIIFILLCLLVLMYAVASESPRSAQLSADVALSPLSSPAIATPILARHSALDEPLGDVFVAGTTLWDAQANGSAGRMINVLSDGRVQLVWTYLDCATQGGNRWAFTNTWYPNDWGFATPKGHEINASVRSGYPNISAYRDSMGVAAYHDRLRDPTLYPVVCTIPFRPRR